MARAVGFYNQDPRIVDESRPNSLVDRALMHVIYDSDDYWVLEFLKRDLEHNSFKLKNVETWGYEIIAKSSRRSLFISGRMAINFRVCLQSILEGHPDADVDDLDEFLDDFQVLIRTPIVLH